MKWMMWWVSIDGALIDDRIMEIMGLRSASLVRAEGRGPGPLLPWKMDKNGEQVGPSFPRAAAQWSVITDHRSLVTATSPIWKWRSCKPWLKMFLPISLLSPLPICLLPLCFPSEWKSYPLFSSFCSQPFLRTILAMLQTPWCQVLFPFILIFFSCFKSIILFLVVIENYAINVNLKFWRLKCLFFFSLSFAIVTVGQLIFIYVLSLERVSSPRCWLQLSDWHRPRAFFMVE